MMEWDAIANDIKNASVEAINQLLEATKGEKLYAIALYTADDGMSIAMAANTEEFYRAHLAEEAADEPNSPEDEAYYRWSTAEWKFEGWKDEFFSDINNKFREYILEYNGDVVSHSIDVMTSSLINVKNIFGDKIKDVVLFVTITDSDEAEKVENQSATRINTPTLAQMFISRFD